MPGQPNNTAAKFSLKIILLSGLLVGTLDILAAFTDYYITTQKNPITNVLPYIASGVFGKSAFTGDTKMILLGLLFHYIIAFGCTFFFFWLYSKTTILSKNRIITGVVYGICIWIVTVLVILQLSNAPHPAISAMKIQKVIKAILILICMIGLPLSFIAYKYAPLQLKRKQAGDL